MIRFFTFSVMLLALNACDKRKTLVEKPSINLDPLPTLNAPGETNIKDPLVGAQWNLDRVGLNDPLSNVGDGNPNVRVAILATGVDYNHEDLVGKVAINKLEITPDGPDSPRWINKEDDEKNGLVDDIVGYDVVDKDGFAFDRHGRGTELAGIIAARADNGKGIVGIADRISIYPVRYIDDNGRATTVRLLKALDVLVKTMPDVALIEASYLKFRNKDIEISAIKEMLEKVRKLDIPIVVGAGNSNKVVGESEFHKMLLKFDNIVFITSSTKDDQLQFLSNYSAQYVATAAPGDGILTTTLGNQYKTVHSSSFAAAHVAAAFALVLSKKGKIGATTLISRLSQANAGDDVPALRTASLGRNRLNIKKYLSSF